MSKRDEVTVARQPYGKGQYYLVMLGPHVAGTMTKEDGGYVAIGTRKPLPFGDAVIRVLQRRVTRALGEAAMFARAMENAPRTLDEAQSAASVVAEELPANQQ